jgi:hypothetical protein
MNFRDELKILLIVSIVSLFLDISTSKKIYSKCKSDPRFMPFLFLHHLISAFCLIGWMSSYKKVLISYIATLIIIFVHWKTNDDKCWSTDYINNLCGIEIKFRDFYYFVGLKDQMELIVGIFAFIAFIKIRRM